MFTRKAYGKLLDWKKKGGKTAMLIEGARRVGKTTISQEFARREYESHLYIDFSLPQPDVRRLFAEQIANVPAFLNQLQIITGTRLRERESLIVFDEVQGFPEARQAIKHLVADGRFDYLETGSLISIRRNVRNILIPSEEEHMDLNPMSFEEWLWATDASGLLADAIAEAARTRNPLPDPIHRLAMRSFREYLLVGGMPQAVEAFGAEKDFFAADEVKRQILEVYRADMFKYGGTDSAKVAAMFDAIPGQLARHEKRFVLASLGSNARYRDYADAVFWLGDSRIANVCRKASDPSVGFGLSAMENDFKCYMADTGLLVTEAFADRDVTQNPTYKAILSEQLSINEGMLVENYVAQQIRASGDKLYYYSQYGGKDSTQTMEIDFLLVREFDNAAFKPRVSPVEVKSTSRYSTRSLEKFKAKYGKRVGTQYVLHPRQMSVEGERVRMPLYCAHLL